MIILLDENFPLRFYNRLQKEGFTTQHILLTDRGIRDKQIIARLMQEEVLFSHRVKTSWKPRPTVKPALYGLASHSRCRSIKGSRSGLTP